MNDMRDPNVIIGAWLDEGPTELPETTRRAITTSVRAIDQRRGFALPWGRSVSFQPLLIAAVVTVAVVGGWPGLAAGTGTVTFGTNGALPGQPRYSPPAWASAV